MLLDHQPLMTVNLGALAAKAGEVPPVFKGQDFRNVEAPAAMPGDPAFKPLSAVGKRQVADVLGAVEQHVIDAHEGGVVAKMALCRRLPVQALLQPVERHRQEVGADKKLAIQYGAALQRRGDIGEGGRDVVAGRPKGPWFKWKRDPRLIDTVMMYAQRGHGRRSSFYSDFTFGIWRGNEIVPVGKAYSGFTDEELRELDKWVRTNTTNRFGPVREVEKRLVVELAFDSAHDSPRHKSGIALRFPRVSRIRWDKPAAEADNIETVRALIG